MATDKIDLKKEPGTLYAASAKKVAEVLVPPMNFLMLDGRGDPNGSAEYEAVVETLFSVSYAAKFIVKKGPDALDYAVMPLEGLWWVEDMRRFSVDDKSSWQWTMMVMQPDFVAADVLQRAIAEVARKKALAPLPRLRIERFDEGRCAQILHVGPFSTEGPTVAELHRYVDAHGGRAGRHHEIYLSDVRKAEPSKWKTIVRQPMR